MLEHDQVCGGNDVPGSIDMFGHDQIIGAFDDDNTVVAFGKGDMGSTAVLSGQDADITGIDVVGFQVVDDHSAVSIVAYAAYHVYLGS